MDRAKKENSVGKNNYKTVFKCKESSLGVYVCESKRARAAFFWQSPNQLESPCRWDEPACGYIHRRSRASPELSGCSWSHHTAPYAWPHESERNLCRGLGFGRSDSTGCGDARSQLTEGFAAAGLAPEQTLPTSCLRGLMW